MTLTEQELRWAQRDVFNAVNELVSAGLRLQGTQYEKAYLRIYKALNALNRKLIKDINKKKR